MTTPLDAHSTADDVLDGTDLTGTLALVTGGYSGIGLETTRALVRRGAHVVVPARRPEVALAAVGDLPGVEVDALDLADPASVAGCAARLLSTGRRLDLVIANAGIMACPETRVGPGWEAQLATNHLGHFALVNRLWPAVAAGKARVVVLTSGIGRMHWDDLQLRKGYDRWKAYGQAKLANRLFAGQLDVLGRQHGVRAFSVAPGYILTPLQRHLTRAEMVEAGWVDAAGNPVGELFKTPRRARPRRSGQPRPHPCRSRAACTARTVPWSDRSWPRALRLTPRMRRGCGRCRRS